MIDVPLFQVLVIAGDYDLIQRVNLALQEGKFIVQYAYSYRDAVYALESKNFDVVLVDGLMTDRISGESVIQLLDKFQAVPMILLAHDGELPAYPQPPIQMVLGALDKRTILRGVYSVIEVSLVRGQPLPRKEDDHINEIETVFALGKSLTEVLDLSEVLNRVVAAARYLTYAEEGMILLPDENEEDSPLYLRARVGIDDEIAQNFRIKMEDTVAGRVFHTGQPQLIGAQGLQKVKTHYFVKALLYVPILLQGRPIGVLGVNNKLTDQIFDTVAQDLLMNLASFAAIAIENARIHEETLQRTRELQSLVEASQALNVSVSLYTTLPSICEQLSRVLNVSWAEILTWDREGEQLRPLARYQNSLWREGPVTQLAKFPALQAALAERHGLQVDMKDHGMPAEVAELKRLGAQKMLVVPVTVEKQLLGVVRSYFVTPPEKLISNDTVHSVQNLALQAVAGSSNGNMNSRHLVQILESVNRIFGANWSDIALMTNKGQAFIVEGSVGSMIWLDFGYPALHEAISRSLMPVFQDQIILEGHNGLEALLEITHSQRVLAMPLAQRGQTQGVVLFGDTRNNRKFSKREIDLGKAIIGQAATALENANLVHDLERSLQELKDAQERLVETARLSAMGELAAVVAHQINNPLTTILVDTEMMLLDESPDSRNYESLTAVSRAGKRAAGVVRRLLATARPTEEDAPIERIDVLDTIEGTLSLVRNHIEQDNIRVVPQLPAESFPPVLAVQGQIDDIWLNLLLNAHDALAGRPGAEIGIQAEYLSEDAAIEVIVWDNGPGIPTHILDEIFKPFFTTKPVGEGTGLGLHICRQVIERVGGTIMAENTPEGGAYFTVRLPVEKETK